MRIKFLDAKFYLGIFLIFFFYNSIAANDIFNLSGAVIVVQPEDRHAAHFLKEEIYLRSGLNLQIANSMPGNDIPAIVLGQQTDYLLPVALSVPAKAESFALWIDAEERIAPTILVIGRDNRGVLFGAGKLIRKLYLSNNHISIPKDVVLASAPADIYRAHQILNPQSNDGFMDPWNNEIDARQHINDMVLFGANGFEHRAPKVVDTYLEQLGLDLFIILVCQRIIDFNEKSDHELINIFSDIKGINHITTYGGDAAGSRPPQEFFPAMERVLPLILQGLPGVKWWYSNQNLERHTIDYNDYIFDYLNENKPSWLYGMVYGPWTRGGISDLRERLPSQYVMRHYPEICHPRWSQYPIPKWDRIFAVVWPRNRSIYMMPTMMLNIYKSTREGTDGILPYSHTGTYNDLNKFVWSAAAWNPEIDVETILTDYAKVFFAHDFIKHPHENRNENSFSREELIDAAVEEVVKGLLLLESNWVGPLRNNSSTEAALQQWKLIADCIGGPQNNWRVEMMLYKARIDAQIKRKYDFEMQLESEAYKILENAGKTGINTAIDQAKNTLARIDSQFQTKEEFLHEISELGLTGKFGDLDEIADNIYSSFNDRYWIEKQLTKVKTIEDIQQIIHYEDPCEGGFYDNLGVEGKQPHLYRQISWQEDPGFVHSPIEWVDNATNSEFRHSQHTHALSRYETPLVMRWEGLEKEVTYQIKVVYNGPWDPLIKCETDNGLLIHDFRPKANNEILIFSIPQEATSDGTLQLHWTQDADEENMYRGVSVSEIWLTKIN